MKNLFYLFWFICIIVDLFYLFKEFIGIILDKQEVKWYRIVILVLFFGMIVAIIVCIKKAY